MQAIAGRRVGGRVVQVRKNAPDVVKRLAYPGEIAAVLGGNGAGETTALSLAARLYSPTRGKIRGLGCR